MTSTTDTIQRLAGALAAHPEDEETASALCSALIRRGHGPDLMRLLVYILKRQVEARLELIVRDEATSSQKLTDIDLICDMLLDDAKASGLGDLLAPTLDCYRLSASDHVEDQQASAATQRRLAAEYAGESPRERHVREVLDAAEERDVEAWARAMDSETHIYLGESGVGDVNRDACEGVLTTRYTWKDGPRVWRVSAEPPGRLLRIESDLLRDSAWVGVPGPEPHFWRASQHLIITTIPTPPDLETTVILERIE